MVPRLRHVYHFLTLRQHLSTVAGLLPGPPEAEGVIVTNTRVLDVEVHRNTHCGLISN